MIVASYCRVSTDRTDQANSFQAQQRYFREYIANRAEWELYEIYADEGITGTSTNKRIQFRRMMEDAHAGKFQLILTKEVSRFSRNILDTIAYTRELKQLGIGVLFMNDGIHTLEPDAELRLSIMGSIAQEESRKTSSRVKWGQLRQMERGVVFGRSLLGYDVRNGQLIIKPEEAETVRWIFHQYGVEKKGTSAIAKTLMEAGVRTARDGSNWSSNRIIRMLKNEKYVGDLVQKKTYTPDYLTHIKCQNRGAEPLVTIRNHHEGIVDRELWDLVQSELQQRSGGKNNGGFNRKFALSGKIRCGECGAPFVARKKYRRDGSWYRRWHCRTVVQEGMQRRDAPQMGCGVGRLLRDDQAMLMLQQIMQALPLNRKWVIDNVTSLVQKSLLVDAVEKERYAGRLMQELQQLNRKQEAVLDAYFSGTISREEWDVMRDRIARQRTECTIRLHAVQLRPAATETGRALEELRQNIIEIVSGETIAEAFFEHILEQMVVFRDKRVEIRLRGLSRSWIFAPEEERRAESET